MEKEEIAVKVERFIGETFVFDQNAKPSREESLLDTGIIDSTGVLELIGFLEETFEIAVEDEELVPANLDSIEKITNFVVGKVNHH